MAILNHLRATIGRDPAPGSSMARKSTHVIVSMTPGQGLATDYRKNTLRTKTGMMHS
ncbi:MAG TPA: hypothetical protein HPQ00_06495 [Magnetococcales bacterium]|nr:hypothetical protein [Magnetococcales bacterium]